MKALQKRKDGLKLNKNMSEEERERFKAKFRHRPYWFGPFEEEKKEDREE